MERLASIFVLSPATERRGPEPAGGRMAWRLDPRRRQHGSHAARQLDSASRALSATFDSKRLRVQGIPFAEVRIEVAAT
jgi:hypothetical protein